MESVPELEQRFAKKITSARSPEELDAIEHELLGRKAGVLTVALKGLGAVAPEERRARGEQLNALKERLAGKMEERRRDLGAVRLASIAEGDRLDATLDLPPKPRGHLHLIPEFIRLIEDVFGRMGFDVARGPELESERYNFSLLNFEDEHPARDAHDTFWIAKMDGMVLRTHTSNVQIHYMQKHKPPFRMICPGRVYRKDADATHSPMFHQFEGLMVGKDISLAHMKAVMAAAMRELLASNIEFRFRTSYFPFVEPGLEVDMRWMDERKTKEGDWLEVCGCGMVHPNVLKNVGIDSSVWQGFAFGFGVERLLMIKHGIRDLRAFYESDVRFLAQF